jgi:hypothetical protein
MYRLWQQAMFYGQIECKREWHYIQLVEGAKARPTSANPSETTKACINNCGLYGHASKSLPRSAFSGTSYLSTQRHLRKEESERAYVKVVIPSS